VRQCRRSNVSLSLGTTGLVQVRELPLHHRRKFQSPLWREWVPTAPMSYFDQKEGLLDIADRFNIEGTSFRTPNGYG
jgi:hypothetical protein